MQSILRSVRHPLRLALPVDGAGDPTDLWIVPGAGHCGAYFVGRPAYVTGVTPFFEPHLRVGSR